MASVKMPQLGESITEGTISKWLKQPGDQVKKYEGLVEIITDKVNAEVPAPLAGVLKEIKVKEGTTVTVGTEIAVIEESVAAGAPTPTLPRVPGREQEPVAQESAPAIAAPIPEEVKSAVAANGEQRQAAAEARPGPAAPAGETKVPLTPMRRSIASNMLKSKQTIPHAWTVAEVDMSNVVRFRHQVKDSFKQREGVDLTFVPIIVKAVVEGLKAVPALNASWSDDGVVLHKDINVGVAVSVDDGLIVPVVHQADRMSIAGLAKSIDDLARRARATKLTIADVQGATFTVNNPGTFGTILSYSIIAPPQAGILAMDAIVKRPVVVEGDAIAIRSMMNLCLSFDHRVLDGVSAARFLQGVRRWLEGFSEQVPLY
ncbi:MAG: hypothetical protein AUG96_01880 [Chloroflexi bacterium 13_1_20CM_4_66_15]|nr:MAG: hypothetical protein AUG96_01880 [Chloroflexi bacterium 13_1_20CM_4_66_15]